MSSNQVAHLVCFYSPLGDVCGWTLNFIDAWLICWVFLFASWRRLGLDPGVITVINGPAEFLFAS